ncbi:MAG: cupin domain-containing protein [Nitrosopumilaceae archaeon]|jgi:mannose-6-phosphate isomerase-like protein (cupin superfamily)|uniref:Cupin domain-containing protein n=2 Tax=Candidatus Nitrosomaritimum aestuariumsis TaxID=3342354 RepID=A0AC60W834_9ARCH|nr:cupin domain-containing protein [Nitrosopumilaceae archaeon]MBA4461964.1 cupin domain-containing protein [Nitrosopumilaceae archaeon]MBA4463545.1 cupin domain-containing protein [Nitrosopumilaceae archaeon]NCF22645.1 cupin domain-containing protein [Nitrosopumilaceae archaeon]
MKLDYDVSKYIEKIKNSDEYFHTFINKQSLAAGVLVLQPGEEDTQEPHQSDEVYFIIKGNGFLKIKNKDYPVEQNKMYFVGKEIEHYFHGNTKELIVLYFFGGPDS